MNLHKQILGYSLFIIFSLHIKAQNINSFYFETNMANNLAKAGKIDSAITVYEDAFKKVGYVNIIYLRKIVEISKLNKDKGRVRSYSKRIKSQRKGTNSELKSTIDSLIKIDQKVRKNKYRKSLKYYDDNDIVFNQRFYKLKKHRVITDSSNKFELTKLLIENNFIGEELVGTMRYHAVITMLLHFNGDTSIVNLYPILKKGLVDGKLQPIHFAECVDKYSLFYNKMQKYWTLPYIGKEKLSFTESDFLPTIKLRESIGIYDSKFWQEKKRKYWLLRNKYNF